MIGALELRGRFRTIFGSCSRRVQDDSLRDLLHALEQFVGSATSGDRFAYLSILLLGDGDGHRLTFDFAGPQMIRATFFHPAFGLALVSLNDGAALHDGPCAQSGLQLGLQRFVLPTPLLLLLGGCLGVICHNLSWF